MTTYCDFSDRELTDLLVEGDRKAFTQIFRKYNGILFAHAYKKLNDQENAKDIVQEIFSILWAKRKEITFRDNLSGYLYAAVKNKILDFISHKSIEDRYADSLRLHVSNSVSVTDHLIREKQMREMIEREIENLPPRMRLVFDLSRKQHLSHKEIAEKLAISEHTVTDQIKKALKSLKTRLGTMISIVIF